MRTLTAALACLLLVAGCGDDERTVIEGSGNLATETREVSGFDEISIAGFGEVTVAVGPVESLVVEAEDNVLPYLVTEVSGDTLRITSEENVSFQNVQEPRYTVTMPSLTKVTIAGSGGVTATGVATERFEVTISGSGDVIPTGTASSLKVTISGSGTFLGEDLIVADAGVSIAGSGTILVHATGNLDASISGSGSITYFGDPAVTRSISGSGSIAPG